MSDARQQLRFALDKYAERIEVVPLEELVLESARQNPKRPAYVKLALPDDMVKALRGSREGKDVMLLVSIPRDVLERAESRIVLPGEVR